MSYEIEGRNVIAFPARQHAEPYEPFAADDNEPSLWEKFDGLPVSLILAVLAVAGLIVFGAIYYGAPASLYCIGGAAITAIINYAYKAYGARDASHSLRERLIAGLLADSRLAGLFLTIGLAVVWLTQIGINQAEPTNPNAVGTFELRLYEWAERANTAGSFFYMLGGLFIALLLSMFISARWPLIAFGWARKLLSALIPLFAAASSFSFVAPAALAPNNATAISIVRAQIARNLEELARLRAERAALQWIAAEFTHEAAENPRARESWQAYFDQVRRRCAAESSCSTNQLATQLASQRMPSTGHGNAYGNVSSRRRGPWLPEYRSAIPEPPASAATHASAVPDPLLPLELDPHLRGSEDLIRMRTSVRVEVTRATTARDTIRTVIVEALGEMLGPDLGRLADQVVDVWRNAILEVFATEGEDKIARRMRALHLDVRNPFAAPSGLAEVRLQDFPVESPHAAVRRAGSMDRVVRSDWDAIYAREFSPEAVHRERFRMSAPDFNLPHGSPHGRVRVPSPPRVRVPSFR